MPHTVEYVLNDGRTVIEYGIMSSIKSVDLANEEFSDELRSSMQRFFYSSSIAKASFVENALKNIFEELQCVLKGDSMLIPGYAVVAYAKDWIRGLFLETEKLGLRWIEPHMTANSDGEIVIEWWHGVRKLTVYIGNQSAEYVKVWGKSADSLITDGNAETIRDCRLLWIWLVN